jgi:hypothetical protein
MRCGWNELDVKKQHEKEENHKKAHPGDYPKIEGRISPLLNLALELYMRDRHLENRSEVLKSALGQFLEREGYLVKTVGEEVGEYKVTTPEERATIQKKIGFIPQAVREQLLRFTPGM